MKKRDLYMYAYSVGGSDVRSSLFLVHCLFFDGDRYSEIGETARSVEDAYQAADALWHLKKINLPSANRARIMHGLDHLISTLDNCAARLPEACVASKKTGEILGQILVSRGRPLPGGDRPTKENFFKMYVDLAKEMAAVRRAVTLSPQSPAPSARI